MEFDAFKKDCQGFIFNWYRVTENAKALHKQFSDLGIDTYVINSDESENDNEVAALCNPIYSALLSALNETLS